MKVWRRLLPIVLLLFFLSLLSTKTRRAPWYEQWTWNAIAPLTSLLAWAKRGTQQIWRHYFFLVDVTKENERLRQEFATLRQRLETFQTLTQENRQLKLLLGLKEQHWPKAIAARVIAFDPRSEFRVVRIDRGSQNGIRSHQPVVTLEGLVGQIGPVFTKDALVLLIVDPASHVDVLVQRNQLRGLLSGSGWLRHVELKHGYFLTHLEYLKKESDLQVGDTLITTGLDRLFPQGILVGTVTTVRRDRSGLFLAADVLPAVDLTKLQHVLVLEGL